MSDRRVRKPKPGEMVTFTRVPPGLLDNLPQGDQEAIRQIVGKPVRLEAYDEDGRAELMFVDSGNVIHFIYVDERFIEPVD